jgi:hypothetical protein
LREAVWSESDPIDRGLLGEYAALLQRDGDGAARRVFPAVAEHLATGCPACDRDLLELLELLERDEP